MNHSINPSSTGYVHLVSNVVDGTKDLLSAHMQQMGEEVKSEVDRATNVMAYFSAAGTLMGIGFVCAIIAFTQLLQERYGFSGTAAWGATGLITFVFGIIMLGIARQRLTVIQWFPKQSLQSLQESLTWITRR